MRTDKLLEYSKSRWNDHQVRNSRIIASDAMRLSLGARKRGRKEIHSTLRLSHKSKDKGLQ